MDQREVLRIAKEYASSVRKVLPESGVYLYGSYARGNAGRDSDIDIAVIVDELPEDYLGTLALLWRLTRGDYDYIDIEPVLLKSGDDKSGFSLLC